MKHILYTLKKLLKQGEVSDASLDELNIVLFEFKKLSYIFQFSRGKVIDDGDLTSPVCQFLSQMRTNKTGTPGDYYFFHTRDSFGILLGVISNKKSLLL